MEDSAVFFGPSPRLSSFPVARTKKRQPAQTTNYGTFKPLPCLKLYFSAMWLRWLGEIRD